MRYGDWFGLQVEKQFPDFQLVDLYFLLQGVPNKAVTFNGKQRKFIRYFFIIHTIEQLPILVDGCKYFFNHLCLVLEHLLWFGELLEENYLTWLDFWVDKTVAVRFKAGLYILGAKFMAWWIAGKSSLVDDLLSFVPVLILEGMQVVDYHVDDLFGRWKFATESILKHGGFIEFLQVDSFELEHSANLFFLTKVILPLHQLEYFAEPIQFFINFGIHRLDLPPTGFILISPYVGNAVRLVDIVQNGVLKVFMDVDVFYVLRIQFWLDAQNIEQGIDFTLVYGLEFECILFIESSYQEVSDPVVKCSLYFSVFPVVIF